MGKRTIIKEVAVDKSGNDLTTYEGKNTKLQNCQIETEFKFDNKQGTITQLKANLQLKAAKGKKGTTGHFEVAGQSLIDFAGMGVEDLVIMLLKAWKLEIADNLRSKRKSDENFTIPETMTWTDYIDKPASKEKTRQGLKAMSKAERQALIKEMQAEGLI